MATYPTIRQVLYLSLFACLLAQVVVFPLLTPYSARFGLAGAELALLVAAALFLRGRRMVLEDLLLLNAVPWRALLLALPIAAAAGVLVEEVDRWFVVALASWGYQVPLSLQRDLLELQLVGSLPELGWVLLAVTLVPAVCEEAFFRGLVLTSLYAGRGSRTAVLGSAALFAFAHFSPWHLPALFLLGLLLAVLVYWTHSVYPAMLAHLANNMLSIAEVNLEAYTGVELVNPASRAGLLLLAAGVLVSGLLLLRRHPPVMPLTPGDQAHTGRLGVEVTG
jgi:membrane protease YdiL (CAAX protease family)